MNRTIPLRVDFGSRDWWRSHGIIPMSGSQLLQQPLLHDVIYLEWYGMYHPKGFVINKKLVQYTKDLQMLIRQYLNNGHTLYESIHLAVAHQAL